MHSMRSLALLHMMLDSGLGLVSLRHYGLAAGCTWAADSRSRALLACVADDTPRDPFEAEPEDFSPDLTDCTCSGRATARFTDTEDGSTLGERFDMQVRALQGDFSPADKEMDNERGDSVLLEGLVGFPAQVPVKVVTYPSTAAEQEALLSLVSEECINVVGVAPTRIQLTPRLGGKVASIAFIVLVGSASSLTTLREKLRTHPGVRMVF